MDKSLSCRALIVVFAGSMSMPASARVIEEVIVTAQKKEESLQDTPIALDAFNEEALAREGISNVGDLANNVPALTIQPFPINTTTLRIYIRGIGLIDAQVTQDSAVGVYIDGAYIARSAALTTDIADLSRIEVLRGPQGTLYGRNSTGGAVNLVTRKPNIDEPEFKQALGFGDRNLLMSKTVLNTPLWDDSAAKIAYFRKRVDGYIENTGEGGNFGDSESEGLRLDFSWMINDQLSVDMAYDRAEVENVNVAYAAVRPSEQLAGASQATTFNNLIRSGARQFFKYNENQRRPEKMYSAIPVVAAESEIDGYQFSVDYQFSEKLNMKYMHAGRELYDNAPTSLATGSISDGYRLDNNAAQSFAVAGQAGGAAPCSPCLGRNVFYDAVPPGKIEQQQYSHEFQLSGDLFDTRVSYITGLYYFEEDARQGNGHIGHLLSGPLGSTADGNNTGNRVEVLAGSQADIANTALAVFSQFSWRPPILDDRLQLTIGARHSEDNRQARMQRRQVSFLVTPASGDNRQHNPNDIAIQLADDFYDVIGDRDFKDDSFTFITEYEVSEEINIYGKISEAYKSGGFNTREQISDAGAKRFSDGFAEEKVLAYELGIKSRFMDNRVQVNADIFEQEFTNQQLNFSVPDTVSDTTVANAGTSTLTGFEMDATWLANDSLMLVANYAYLDAEVSPSRNPLTGEVDNGFVFDSAPRNAYTLAMDWTIFQSGDAGRLALNSTYAFTDERNGGARREFATFSADRQDDYGVLNARLGWYALPILQGLLDLSVWGKNLLDEEYSLNNIHGLPHSDRGVLFAEPTSYGVDLVYTWNR